VKPDGTEQRIDADTPQLADAVVAHATSNALIAVYVLVGGAWSLWS
jgi:hypothetical protein